MSKEPVDLTLGSRKKPEYKPLVHPDGSIEMIDGEEWRKYVQNNPLSPTARRFGTPKTDAKTPPTKTP